MNGVVALGRHAGPFLDEPVHVVHVDPDAVLDDLAALHEVVAEQLALQPSIVVVYPDRLGDAPARALSTVRTALGAAPVLWHATRLPPLAADVLVTLAGALHGPLGGVAEVAAALPVLESQLVHLTWLPTVSGLTEPSPSVVQHARSALPGASWLVTSWPDPAVRRLTADDPPPLPRPAQPIGVALADLDGERRWVVDLVGPQLPDAAGVEVDPPADSARWWGAKRVTQVVLYPRSIEALAQALRPHIDPGPCAWCRRWVGSAECPWCALPRSGAPRQEVAGGTSDGVVFAGAEGTGGAAGGEEAVTR